VCASRDIYKQSTTTNNNQNKNKLQDDIERLLEYVAIGPRFSNGVLQALLVLVKRQPPEGRRLLVIGTSSAGEVLDSMGLAAAFNVQLHVPALRPPEIAAVLEQQGAFDAADAPRALAALERYCGREVPVKKLLLWLEMARQALPDGGGSGGGGGKIPLDTWEAVLQDLSS
jgi:vesicle-fusing ATPase